MVMKMHTILKGNTVTITTKFHMLAKLVLRNSSRTKIGFQPESKTGIHELLKLNYRNSNLESMAECSRSCSGLRFSRKVHITALNSCFNFQIPALLHVDCVSSQKQSRYVHSPALEKGLQ